MRTGIIYGYVNLETGKMYIGKTLHPKDRWKDHRFGKYKNGWHVDYQKNPDKYEYSVIEYDIPEDKLNEREIYWISFFGSYRNGYNLTIGGDGCSGREPWNKGKTGIYCNENNPMYGKHHSEKTKKKMSDANKGENHPNYGKHHSEETKKKMSDAHKGENNPNYGKHHSEETKKKMSDAHKGENNSFYGKHHSEETKRKIRKQIIQYSKSGQFIKEWSSVKEAAEYLNKYQSNISNCLKGRCKSAYGYVWKYK